MNKGIVYLIGSGCGKKDLITLKGLEKIKEADVIVYDDLIDSSLLNENPSAELIYMGKRNAKHSSSQEEITKTLIKLSKEGKTVARLKGGDPFVFGRGGEEILSLQKEDIPFVVVPGISSCIALPEMWGLPVTHRKLSRGFMCVTGHTADNTEEDELLDNMARFNGTIVILMGLTRLSFIASSLIEKGKDKNTPVAVLKGGNAPQSIKVVGTLSNISKIVEEKKVETPAVIVIGDVVNLDLTDSSSIRTLKNVRVGITGTEHFTKKMRDALEEKGADVTEVLKTKAIENEKLSLKEVLKPYNKWVVLTSSNGVRTFFSKLRKEDIDIRMMGNIKFAVIGKPTGETLKEYGIKADLIPDVYTSENLAKSMIENIEKSEEIILLRADNASSLLPSLLKEAGYKVQCEELYKVVVNEKKEKSEDIDYLTFSSSYGVKLFFNEYKAIDENVKVVAIGDITASTLREYYKKDFIVSKKAEVGSIIDAINEDYKN